MNYLLKEVSAATHGISSDLVLRPDDEAKICFSCKKKDCSGSCKRFYKEKRKIKEKGLNGLKF